MKRLPEWALRDEIYSPDGGNDYFISRSLLRIMKILRAFRYRAKMKRIEKISAAAGIFFALSLIFLCVLSRTTNFLFCVLALEMILLCLLDGETIFSTVRNSFAAAVFAALFLLPAFFLGNPNLIFILPLKIFLTTTALGLLTNFFTENQLTRALKNFRVPAVMIFILDTTLRYIVLLGEISQDMLTALKIRSVGKNRDKKKSVSGILGTVFLKSKEMSEEMYMAMRCRCFTGEYLSSAKSFFRPGDLIFVILLAGYVALFLISEGVIKL